VLEKMKWNLQHDVKADGHVGGGRMWIKSSTMRARLPYYLCRTVATATGGQKAAFGRGLQRWTSEAWGKSSKDKCPKPVWWEARVKREVKELAADCLLRGGPAWLQRSMQGSWHFSEADQGSA
jgi:hypothetical protein